MPNSQGSKTVHKTKFSIKDFISKCNQIRSSLRIWSHLLKKFLMENFIFCAVFGPSVKTSFFLLVTFPPLWTWPCSIPILNSLKIVKLPIFEIHGMPENSWKFFVVAECRKNFSQFFHLSLIWLFSDSLSLS